MAPLTKELKRTYEGEQDEIQVILGEGDTYYPGAILVFNAAGFAINPDNTANQHLAGIFTGLVPSQGILSKYTVPAGNTTTAATVYRGRVWLYAYNPALSAIGDVHVPINSEAVSEDTLGVRTIGSVALGYRDGNPGEMLLDLRTETSI